VEAGLLEKGQHKAQRIIDIERKLDQVIAGQHAMLAWLGTGPYGDKTTPI
jgi:hypothetical protein